MSEQPQAGDVWVKNGESYLFGADGAFVVSKDVGLVKGNIGVLWPGVATATLLVRDGKPVPQPAPEPVGDVIEIAVMESSSHDRHTYAVGQLGQPAPMHAGFYEHDKHVATIRAVLPPRSVPVVEGTVTTR